MFYVNDHVNINWSKVLLTNKISGDSFKDEDDIDHIDVEDDHFLATSQSFKIEHF